MNKRSGLLGYLTNFAVEAQNLRVQVKRLSQRSIEFDINGVDASIANAFRRIMIAEVCHSILFLSSAHRFHFLC